MYNPQTNEWSGDPDTIIFGSVEIHPINTTYAGNIAKFTENRQNSKIKLYKHIIHPGPIKKILKFPSNSRFLCSVSGENKLYLWNTINQPYRSIKGVKKQPNKPDGM